MHLPHHSASTMPNRQGLALVVALLCLVAAPLLADEQTDLVGSFYGVVTVDGTPVPDGTPVTALVGGTEYASAMAVPSPDGSVVIIDVPADVPDTPELEGATAGQTVTFRVGGVLAPEMAVWSTGDHARIDLSAAVGADLAVQLDDGTSVVSRGETVTYTLTVDNLGDVEATGIVLRQTLPAYADLVSADGGTPAQGAIEWPSFSLAAGDQATRTVVVTVDPATPVQVLQLSSSATVADDGGAGFDPDLDNNSATDTDSLTAPPAELPDLAIGYDNLVVDPAAPQAGDTVSVSGVVRNVGLGMAIASPLEVYDGDPASGGLLLGSVLLDDIAPGGNQSFGFEWIAGEGVHTIHAVADPGGSMLEISTDNNRTERTVVVPRSAGPDLEVSILDASGVTQSPLDLRMQGQAQVDVHNTGDETASAPFVVLLYVDADGDRAQGDGEPAVAQVTVSADLAVGATTTVALDVDATTAFLRPLVWALVDADDRVAERREDNNQAPLFGACEVPPPAPSIEPAEEWWLRGVEIESVPIVVQLSDDNGDGRIDSRDVPDVVFHTTDDTGDGILAVSGLDGERLWMLRAEAGQPVQGYLAQAAAGDLDGDGVAEVIGHRSDGRLVAVDHTGAVLWVSDPVEGVGNRGLGGPVLGDLDGDGVPEIAYGRAVVSNTGRLLATGTTNQGQNYNYYGPFGTVLPPGWNSLPFSVIADIDLDGRNELVAGDAAYRLVDGQLEVVWDRTEPDNLMRDGFAALGNFDSDPYAEIVYLSSNQLTVINHDGSTFASRRVMIPFSAGLMPTYWGGPPAVADLDGDGVAEILTVGATHISAYRGNLSLLWRQPVPDDFGGVHGITAFDLDGDGAKEVLYSDELEFHIYDGASGAELYSLPNLTKTGNEHPIVVDVDGDGRAEILLASNTFFDGDASTRGLHVLGNPSWQGAPPIYHQASYHVGGSLLDGTIPSIGRPSWQVSNAFRATRELPPPELYRPNLTLSVPRIGAASPEGIPVTLRVGNGGAEVVPPGARLALFRGPVGSSEAVVDIDLAFGLRPGAWRDVTVFWQGMTTSGTLASAKVDWSADGPGSIEECSEGDNSVQFTIDETLLADLSITDLNHSATAVLGQNVAFTVAVRNDGWADAETSTLRLAQSPGGQVLAETQIAGVPAGEDAAFELRWDTLSATVGNYDLSLVTDATDVVLEQDELNNAASTSIELLPRTLPDLSLEELNLTPPAGAEGDSILLTARILNRGLDLAGGFDVSFSVNGAEVGRVTSGDDLLSGASRDIEFVLGTLGRNGFLVVAAMVDPASQIAEDNEANNQAQADLTIEASALTIFAGTDRPSYDPNEDLTVTATTASLDTLPVDVAERIRIVDSSGLVVAEVAAADVTVPSGTSSRSYPWNTGSTPPGAYSARAEVLVGGIVRARGESAFTLAADLSAEAVLSSDRESYSPDSSAEFMGSISNLSVNATLTELTATLAVANADGSTVYRQTIDLPVLVPSATAQIDATWPIEFAPPGLYTASLSVRDVETALIAYHSVALTVEDSGTTGAGLVGSLDAQPDPVAVGEPLFAAIDVTNGGNSDMPDLQLRVDLALQSDEVIVASHTEPLPLSQGGSVHGGFGFETDSLTPDTYVATLVGVLPGREVRLDRVVFEVVPGLSIGDITLDEGDAGSRMALFTVRLSQPLTDPVTVDYETLDGTAEAGLDYQAAQGSLSFAAGETEKQIQVTVFGDLEVETDEVFLVALLSATGVSLADDQALAILIDEEGCQSPNLLANGDAEAGNLLDPVASWTQVDSEWGVRFGAPTPLSGAASFAPQGDQAGAELMQEIDLSSFGEQIDGVGVEFQFDAFLNSAEGAGGRILVEYLDAAGSMIDAFDSGLLTSADGWQVVVDRRTLAAGARSARVRVLASGATANLAASFDRLSLRSLGLPTIDFQDVTLAEGDSGLQLAVFRFELSCALPTSLAVDVETVDGTALASSDYEALADTVVIPSGTTSWDVSVSVIGDLIDEPVEIFYLDASTMSAEVVMLRDRAVAEVADDDGPVTISVADVNVTEASSGDPGEAVLTVTLSQVSGKQVAVNFATQPGSALAPADFVARTGSLVFEPGTSSLEVAVPLVGDEVHEATETFELVLSSPAHAVLGDSRAVVTVFDDDTVEISVSDVTVEEGDIAGSVAADFGITLSRSSAVEVLVAYATQDGEALADGDYAPLSGVAVFPPGTTEQSVSVAIVSDLEQEPQETFRLVLSAPVEGLLTDPEGTATLVDEDGTLFSARDVQVFEGNDASVEVLVPVELNRVAETVVSVDYVTEPVTALEGIDFVASSGTLVFPAGTVRVDVPLTILPDLEDEGFETFVFRLTNPVDALVIDPEAVVSIADDDRWALNGLADPTTIPGCFQMTREVSNQHASAWRTQRFDLNENFDETYRVFFGYTDRSGGLTFSFQDNSLQALGWLSSFLGYERNDAVTPSLGIEVDHGGSYGPSYDHIALISNGLLSRDKSPPQALENGSKIDDSREHLLRVIWNGATQTFDAHLDGSQRLMHTQDLVNEIFGGQNEVLYGFTAGGASVQYFCETKECHGVSENPSISIGDVTLEEGNDGTSSFLFPVSLSCPADHEVTVQFETRDGAAVAGSDFETTNGTLTFAPGQVSEWVTVEVISDLIPESNVDETFEVALSNAAGGEIRYGSGLGTIIDDDVRWHFNGKAEYGPGGCVQLVKPFIWYQKSSAWRTQKIDLSKHFDMTYQVYLGDHDSGGQGMSFALQNQGETALGTNPSGQGYLGITPSLGLEIDTLWHDFFLGEPAEDHMAVNWNGSLQHNGHPAVPALPDRGDIEDDQLHEVRLTWNAVSEQLDVHFDGFERIVHDVDMVGTLFGGTNEVYFGWTAGVNQDTNPHYFCEVDACYGTSLSPAIQIGNVSVLEGNGGQTTAFFPLTLSCPTDHPVTVRYQTSDGTALVGQDYQGTSGVITFAPGETAKTVEVAIMADLEIEPDETFVLGLSQETGGELRYANGIGTIHSEEIEITLGTLEIVEGTGNTYSAAVELLLLGEPQEATSISYRLIDETAMMGEDFVATTGTVNFSAGQTRAEFRLDIVGDSLRESNETLRIAVTGSEQILDRELRLTILDDDNCPTANLLINGGAEDPLVNGELPGWVEAIGTNWQRGSNPAGFQGSWEFWPGNDDLAELYQDVDVSGFSRLIDAVGQAFVFTGVVRSYPETPTDSSRIVLEYRDAEGVILDTFDSGEIANRSYWQSVGTLRAPPGGTRTIRVRLLSTEYRPSSNNSHYDDLQLRAVGTPLFLLEDIETLEGEAGTGSASFPVTLTCPSDRVVRVNFLTSDGSATVADNDYIADLGTLEFQPGDTSQIVKVTVVGDTFEEPVEGFSLWLSEPVNAGLFDRSATATILPDEVVLGTMASIDVAEGNSGLSAAVFTFTLSQPSELPVHIDFQTIPDGDPVALGATPGVDYVPATGTLVFAPGEVEKALVVSVVGDQELETDETFLLELSNPVNAALTPDQVTVHIQDDDLAVSINNFSITEGDVASRVLRFPVTLSTATDHAVTVDWSTSDVSALAGEDYVAAAGSVTFQPGQILEELELEILSDWLREAGETFEIELTHAVGAGISRPVASVFIVDNDDCPGPDLVRNGGAEKPLEFYQIPDWTAPLGESWQSASHPSIVSNLPFEGLRYFFAGSVSQAELHQDIDVGEYRIGIDQGSQPFLFEGFVASAAEAQPDTTQFIVEYRDESNESVLDSFVSEEIADTSGQWRPVSDYRLAPPGTRWVRIRMLGRRSSTSGFLNAVFDTVTFRSMSNPVISSSQPRVTESDAETVELVFEVGLSCEHDQPLDVLFETIGRSALAGQDFDPRSGSLHFEPGDLEQIVSVAVFGDFELEEAEELLLHLDPVPGVPRGLSEAVGTIDDNDTEVQDLYFVTLSTPPGDGSVSVDLGPFGEWGRGAQIAAGMPNGGDSRYDPLGPIGVSGMVYDSAMAFGRAGEKPIQLRSWGPSAPRTDRPPVGRPGFVAFSDQFALSTFTIERVHFVLRQSVHEIVRDGVRVGSLLVQDYSVTNTDDQPRDFDFTRYVDGDLLNTSEDSGGRVVIDGREFLIETDQIGVPDEATDLVGIWMSDGNVELTSSRWQVDGFSGVYNRWYAGGQLLDRVYYDTDGDGLVDARYDVGLGRRSRFESVQPGEQLSFRNLTFFGSLAPSELNVDIEPVAVARDVGGYEGRDIPLDGSQSFDPDGGEVSFTWDLDGDGAFDDAIGARPVVRFVDEGTYEVSLQVLDSAGHAVVDTALVTIVNAAPVVTVTASEVFGADVVGEVASFIDTGSADSHQASIDWGDGTTEAGMVVEDQGSGLVSGTHRYSSVGDYRVVVCVTDDSDEMDCDEFLVVVEESGAPDLVSTKTDSLADDADGDGAPSPGDVVEYTITVSNVGDAGATGVILRDLVPENTTLIAGSVASDLGAVISEEPIEVDLETLEPGATATVIFQVAIDHPFPIGVSEISNQATVESAELPTALSDDPDLGGDIDPTVTMVTAAPRLVSEKTVALAVDVDGDGLPSPGDVLEYTVSLRNLGNTTATGVGFGDATPDFVTYVVGSATTSAGTIEGEDPMQVVVGEVAVDDEVTITFQVKVDNPLATGVTQIENQGIVIADGLGDLLTDDPSLGGETDPTVVAISAEPILTVEKTATLFTDPGGDGLANPGDEMLYRIEVTSSGNTGATTVLLEDPVPANTSIVPGTVQTDTGMIQSDDPIRADLGTMEPGSVAVITFRVLVDDPFPTSVSQISNQAGVVAAEVEVVMSDDPGTDPVGDATSTEIEIQADLSISDVTVVEGHSGTTEAVFTVNLSNPTSRSVTLTFEVVGGDAVPDVDFQSQSGSLTIPPGETSGAIVVNVIGDIFDENEETFDLVLSGVTGAVVLDDIGRGTILDDDEPSVVSIADAMVSEGDPGSAPIAAFALSLDRPSGFDVTLSYQTADIDAIAGLDYQPVAQTLVIPAGLSSAVVEVPVLADALDEADETFAVQLIDAQQAVVGDPLAVGTILDDDLPPTVTISDVSVPESAGQMLFTLTLSSPSGREIQIGYATQDQSASAGADYASVGGTVVIAAGETTATVAVSVLGDSLDEPDETFLVRLASPLNATVVDGEGVGTILDDDLPPTVTVSDVSVPESAGQGFFTLALSSPSGREIQIGYATQDQSASAGADYTTTMSMVTIGAGETTATITVDLLNDEIDEPDETFLLELSASVNVTIEDGEGVGTILDDDNPPTLSVEAVTVTEAPSAVAVFTVSLSAASGYDISADFATTDGTAVAGVDYDGTTGALEITAGETQTTVTVSVLDDDLDEDDELFDLVLSSVVHALLPSGRGTATILDNDAPPTVSIGDVTISETNGQAVFSLTLSTESGREIQLGFTTVDQTATAATDYMAASGTLTLTAGETEAQIAVSVPDDPTDEPDETFLVRLASPVHVVIDDGEGTGTILDDDLPPTVTLGDSAVMEGDAGSVDANFTLTLSLPSGFDSQVGYATSDGAGSLRPATEGNDYVGDAGVIVIPAGNPSATLAISVGGDELDELDEVFTVTLSAPENVTIAGAEGVGTILDDDEALLGIDDQVVEEGDEGESLATFTVDLTNPSDREIEVSYDTREGGSDDPATEGEDYAGTIGQVIFPPGEQEAEVPVRVFADRLFENDETFEIHLTDPVNAGFRDPLGIGTILDDELCFGPSLVLGGSGELPLEDGELMGWTEVAGSDWTYAITDPSAAEGSGYLLSASDDIAELAQDIDVSAYADHIDGGEQRFELAGWLGQGSLGGTILSPAETRIVIEFRDATNTQVLGVWDSGAPVALDGWSPVASDEFAPVGTRRIRVRLLSSATEPGGNVGHFDGVSVRSVGVPAVWIDDVAVYEADGLPAVFPLHLACPVDGEASVSAQTADGTALAPDDYEATAATVSFAKGEIEAELAVPIVQDEIDESAEEFFVDLSNLLGVHDPVLLDPLGESTILDARACSRSPGYWKNHTEVWPVQWLPIGDQVVDAAGLLAMLQYGGPDASSTLARQLVAAKLNLASGSDPFIVPTVDVADAFLTLFPPGSDPRGSDRSEGLAIKDELDTYNNLHCEGPDPGSGGGGGGGGGGGNGGDDGGGSGTCAHSPGYWKTHHPESWPVFELDLGGVAYNDAELLVFLEEPAADASLGLAHHLVATKLNLLVGADPSIQPTVDEADAFLADHPPGSNPKGQARQLALALKDALDAYNNAPCP